MALRGDLARIAKSAAMRDQLRPIAERVLAAARESAPTASGEYRESLRLEDATTDRAAVRVVADAPHAAAVEARHGTLTRAARSSR